MAIVSRPDQEAILTEALYQLWDVCEDQDAVNLIRKTTNAQQASQVLLDHAIQNYSTDNLSVMVIRFKDFTD